MPSTALTGAYLLDLAVGRTRFGRLPRYHTLMFKLSADALGLTVPTLFTQEGTRPFRAALLAATLAHLENVAITLALAEWRAGAAVARAAADAAPRAARRGR